MSYAAAKQFVSPQMGAAGIAGPAELPWELENGSVVARQETWLLSFIDILALLLTLFVLLLAYQDHTQDPTDRPVTLPPVSTLDFSLQTLHPFTDHKVLVPTVMEVASGFALPGDGLIPQEITPGDGERPVQVEPGPELQETGDSALTEPLPERDEAVPVEAVEPETAGMSEQSTSDEAGPVSPEQGAAGGAIQQRPVDAVLSALNASSLKERVEVSVSANAVNLEISDSILFARASASLSSEGLALLAEIAEILHTLPYNLSVEGHTDDLPIRTPRYPSNWELSSARAAAVTRKLIEKGISAERLRAVGYGETQPRADNATAEGRARNRRVTFVLAVPAEVR